MPLEFNPLRDTKWHKLKQLAFPRELPTFRSRYNEKKKQDFMKIWDFSAAVWVTTHDVTNLVLFTFLCSECRICCLGWWRQSRDAKCCEWGQSSVLSVLFAVTGWWSQMTVTWSRADSSLAWCWCLWPAREVMFVSTDQTWRSCGSPSNRPTTRSSTAGFTSGFHTVSTIFLWLWSFLCLYLTA